MSRLSPPVLLRALFNDLLKAPRPALFASPLLALATHASLHAQAVSVTAPENGDRIVPGTPFVISASATSSAAPSPVTGVEFFVVPNKGQIAPQPLPGADPATGVATLGGEVTFVQITNPGSKYTAPPTVVIRDGPTVFNTTANIDAAGQVVSVDLTGAALINFANVPTVTISAPADPTGVQAAGSAGFSVAPLIVPLTFPPGTAYDPDFPPAVTVTPPQLPGGTQAVAELDFSVAPAPPQLLFTNAGSGYTVAPTITVASPRDGFSVGNVALNPFVATATLPGNDRYTLYAVATYLDGTTATSVNSPVVIGEQGTIPTVSITTPTAATTGLTADVPFEVRANATFPGPPAEGDAVATYELFVNGALFASATNPTFSYTPDTEGYYALVVRVTTLRGLVADSAPVVVNVTQGTPPTVSITSPVATDTLTPGIPATIIADVAGNSGSITQVDFVVNGQVVGSVAAEPFIAGFTPSAAGPYTIFARATDSLGNVKDSASVTVNAVAPSGAQPLVSLTQPTGATSLVGGSKLYLNATATKADGTFDTGMSVTFLVNGVPVTGTPDQLKPGAFSATFDVSRAPFNYVVQAVATQTGGLKGASSTLTITSAVAQNQLPQVLMLDLLPGTDPASKGGVVPLRARATFPTTTPTAQRVEFYANGVYIGEQAAAVNGIYNFNWTIPATLTDTAVRITARAIAQNFGGGGGGAAPVFNGAVLSANLITLNLQAGEVPVPTVTFPSTTGTIPVGIATEIRATVADLASGSIANVDFYANGVLVGSDATAPYAVAWTPTSAGIYALAAVATSTAGIEGASASGYNVSVTSGTPPGPVEVIVNGSATVANPGLTARSTGSAISFTYDVMDGMAGDYQIWETTSLASGVWAPSAVVPVLAANQSGTPAGYKRYEFSVASSGGHKFFRVSYPSTSGPLEASVNQTVTFEAKVTPGDNLIDRVEYYVNGLLVGNSTAAPAYRFALPLNSAGRYSVVARVIDRLGNATDSPAQILEVTDGNPPTVAFTAPTKTTLAIPQVPLTFFWSADDTDGSVTQVELVVNGVVFRAFPGGSGNTTFTFPSQGSYTFVARATDNLGNVADSVPVVVTVDNNQSDPNPVVTMNQQTLVDQGYVVGSQLYFNATAAPQGTNTIGSNSVSFILGSDLDLAAEPSSILSAGLPVYAAGYTIVSGSPTSITAQAIDSDGNVGFSDVKGFYFANPFSPLPSVDLLPPNPSAQPVAGGVLELRAKAFFPLSQFNGGNNPATTRVEFYADGAYLGSGIPNTNAATASAFTHGLLWTIPTNTNTVSYKITARVVQLNFNSPNVDANGNQVGVTPYYGSTFSPQVETINTLTSESPTVVISSPATNGSTVNVGLATPVVARPTVASNASVKEVQFYVDGLLATNTTNSPYIYNFAPANPGLYNIAAVVVDGFGLQGSSEVRTVNAVSGKAPTSFLKTSTSATVTALINTNTKVVTGLTNLVGGSGYSSNAVPDVRMVGGTTNTNATAKAVVSAGGAVTNFTDLTGGAGYTNAPTVVIDPAPVAVGTNTTVLLQATAADTDGTIRQVDFLQNGLIVATVTNTPYNFSLPVTAPGRYELVARATDNLGNVTDSPYIVLSGVSGASPTVSISNPQNSDPVSQVTPGIPVAVTVNAADADGSVARVDLLVNGEVVGFSTQAPYIFTDAGQFSGGTNTTFTPTSEGLYVIVARATDNLGNVTDSEPVTVRAKSPTPVGVAPTVQITQPIGEIYYVTGSSLFLNARATDASPGTVDPDSVEFTVNGLSIPGATVGQVGHEYGVRYTPTVPFAIDTIRAQATDDDGNTTYSQPNYTVLTLAQAPLPQVQMLELLPGQPQDAGGEVTLRAEAIFPPTANQQARVEFYANNVYVGTGTQDTTNPRLYTLAWETPEDEGSYTVEARAVALNFQTNVGEGNVIEYFGSVISDNSIAVNTIPGNAPTVAITSPLAGQTINANQPFTVRATASVPGNVSIVPPSQAVGLTVTSVPVAVGSSVAVDDPLYYVSFFGTPVAVKSTVAGEVTEINIRTGDLITAGLVTMTIKDPAAGGTVDCVEFYANGALIGTDETAPYEATFTPESVGLYNLAALSYSDSGLVGTSAIVPVSSVLGTPPTVILTAPAKAVIGQTARLVATPSILTAGRDIRQVEFLVNNLVVAALTEANDGSSYVYDWPVTAPGIYQVQARATDNVGNVALSSLLELPSRVAPAVLLQAPSSAVIGQVIAMSATVTNPTGGDIASVEFLVNGSVIASDSAAPYSATYTVPVAGAYELQARAVDVEDVAGLSNIISLDVPAPPPPDPTAPTVSIVSPAVGSSVLVGTRVDLTAVASPGDGAAITSVVFSIEDPDRGIISRVATQSGAAYAAEFTPALEGLYTIRATVTNTRGQTATALVGVVSQATPPVPPGSNEAFVLDMYQKILGRVPTGLELSSGTAELDNGLTKAGFVLSLLEGQEYSDVQNRVADFYFSAGVTPTLSAFGTCVADVRANTSPMTGFDDYLATFAWSPEQPPFGATLGQVTAAQRVYNSSGSISRNIADNAAYVRWLFERLGGEVGSLQEVVTRMATYGSNARGAALSFLTANFENIGSVDSSLATAEQGYQYQLRATTVRFLLGGAWQATTLPATTTSPVTRLADLEVSTRDSLLGYIERLLADTAVVLVAPGSATLVATASPGIAGVTSVTAVSGGSGYSAATPPEVILAAPQSATARATATIVNGSVTSISLSNIFNGYYSATPTVTIGQPSSLFSPVAATAAARLGIGATAGRVTNIQVTAAGSGYGSAPWVKVAPPDSVQAAVGPIGISAGGQITNLIVNEPGTGYTTNSPGVLVGAPPEITTATNVAVSLAAKSFTNSPLVTVSTFQLLLNSRPIATNVATGNAMTGNFNFNAPTNIGTNNLSVRAVNAQGMVLGESAWTKLIVTP